jgi:hypothetical protein
LKAGSARRFPPRPGAGRPPAHPAWPTSARPDRPLPKLDDYSLQHVIARSERSTIYRATERAAARSSR